MDDQMDGPTDAVDDEPKPDFEERAVGALENDDIRPGKCTQDQPVEAPVEPVELVYDIQINLPDDMAPRVPIMTN